MKKIVSSIEVKLKKFIALFEDLEERTKKLEEEKKKLEDKLFVYEKDLTQIQEEIRILEISKSVNISDKEGKKNRQKISKYVREIDKCIELLNK